MAISASFGLIFAFSHISVSVGHVCHISCTLFFVNQISAKRILQMKLYIFLSDKKHVNKVIKSKEDILIGINVQAEMINRIRKRQNALVKP